MAFKYMLYIYYADAEHICDGIIGLKQRAHDLALADADASAA